MKEGYMERMRYRSCEDQMGLRQIHLQMMVERKDNLESQIDALRPLWEKELSFDFHYLADVIDVDRHTLWRLARENDARLTLLSSMLAFLYAESCTGTGAVRKPKYGRAIYFDKRLNPYIMKPPVLTR